MTSKRKKRGRLNDLFLLKQNLPSLMKLHRDLLQLELLKEIPAFTTKKYESHDYFKMFEYASLHNISLKQGCIISRIQEQRVPSPEQIMKCCR